MSKPSSFIALIFIILILANCRNPPKNEGNPKHDYFVNLQEVIPGIAMDLRYYSNDNFMGIKVDGYKKAEIIVTKEAAKGLSKAQEELKAIGLGLKVYDAYRPQKAVDHFIRWAKVPSDTLTKQKYYPDISKDRLFELGYIAEKSGHTRGSTLDLTIIDLETGSELDMGSPWDFFGEISHHDSYLVSDEATYNRNILRDVMVRNGFKPYSNEWWHYTLVEEPFTDTYFDFDID